jgi:hypothetical protein
MYIPSFIKIGSGIPELMEGDTQTHGQQDDLISLLICFHNKSEVQQHEAAIRYFLCVCVVTETLRRFVKDPGLKQYRFLVFDLSLKETKNFISTGTYSVILLLGNPNIP